jgi:hypothetical protein
MDINFGKAPAGAFLLGDGARVPDAVQRFFSDAPQSRDLYLCKRRGSRISSAPSRET